MQPWGHAWWRWDLMPLEPVTAQSEFHELMQSLSDLVTRFRFGRTSWDIGSRHCAQHPVLIQYRMEAIFPQ